MNSMQFIFTLCVTVAVVIFQSCGSLVLSRSALGNKYKYFYSLISPVGAKGMSLRDDNIMIQFFIDDAAVNFQLQNLNKKSLRIGWDKTSIGIRGRFYPVRNAQTLYSVNYQNVYSHTIPSYGYTIDLAIPVSSIVYEGNTRNEKDLLQTIDRNSPTIQALIQKNVNARIDFILPMDFEGTTVTYQFAFTVDSVSQIQWSEYKPPERTPPNFLISSNVESGHSVYIVAAVTIAIVGLTVFLAIKGTTPNSGL